MRIGPLRSTFFFQLCVLWRHSLVRLCAMLRCVVPSELGAALDAVLGRCARLVAAQARIVLEVGGHGMR